VAVLRLGGFIATEKEGNMGNKLWVFAALVLAASACSHDAEKGAPPAASSSASPPPSVAAPASAMPASAAAPSGTAAGPTETAWVLPKDGACDSADVCRSLCDAGKPLACGFLAHKISTKEWPGDPQQVLPLQEKACTGGELISCWVLAGKYDRGKAVKHDRERAMVLWRRACDGGLADACDDLGEFYITALPGYEQDAPQAERAWRRGCSLGGEKSCKFLKDLENNEYVLVTTIEDLIISPQKWAGKKAALNNVRVMRFGPLRGKIVPKDGKLADGINARLDEDTNDEVKRDWLHIAAGKLVLVHDVWASVEVGSTGDEKLVVYSITP
jgi:hypothetical protein